MSSLSSFVIIFFVIVVINVRNLNGSASGTFIDLPGAGKLVGSLTTTAWSGQTIFQYLGVKYAEAPSGRRRFKAPLPAKPWDNVRDATKPKKGCPADWLLEPNSVLPDDPEDCLHMSIYTRHIHDRNPVVVFIYSDYFSKGAAKDFAPDYLLEENVVLVVPQFRLGAFGFLSVQPDIPGNVGVHDIVLALEWVHKWISYFGGDPNNVVLAGHSGGAALVQLLTLNNLITGDLFHKVILVSGSLFAPWAFDSDPINNPLYLDNPQLCIREPDPSECFIKTNVTDIIKNMFNKKEVRRKLELYDYEFRLVIDGRNGVLPAEPLELWLGFFKNPKRYSYPTLAGVTKHAGAYVLYEAWVRLSHIIGRFAETESKAFIRSYMIPLLVHLLGLKEESGFLSILVERDFFRKEDLATGIPEKSIHSLLDFFSTAHVKSPILQAAKNAAQNLPESTFLYTFDYHGEHSDFLDEENLKYSPIKDVVSAKDDLQYLFPRPDGKKLSKNDIKIAKLMVSMWTSFARHGVPNVSEDLVQPEPLTNATGPYYRIDKVPSTGECFLEEFFAAVRDYKQGIDLSKKAKKIP